MTSSTTSIKTRRVGDNVWLATASGQTEIPPHGERFRYNILDTEEAVGEAMLAELTAYAAEKPGEITMVLLGGRGAQAMYRLVRSLAETNEIDDLLGRLHIFTQDALAPMRMANGLSFVRDFERLLGPKFFAKIKSFTPMLTETDDLEGELRNYVEQLESLGGIDLFFLGLGPEAEAASHLCYIKPGCGAAFDDFAGIIPISPSILEHHIAKFKIGGSDVSTADEEECRRASSILTLGPAAILGAKRIVQSIVDASTAPAKRASFKRMTETVLSDDREQLERQTDENPGLLIRLHPDVRSYVLSDLVA
ncbi:MAG: hypothetical protein ABJA02_00085 [Acidobacteriota bacterium]